MKKCPYRKIEKEGEFIGNDYRKYTDFDDCIGFECAGYTIRENWNDKPSETKATVDKPFCTVCNNWLED